MKKPKILNITKECQVSTYAEAEAARIIEKMLLQPRIVVKDLVWQDNYGFYTCYCSVGKYTIEPSKEHIELLDVYYEQELLMPNLSLEQAKQAAQEHFNQIILANVTIK